jgi:pimeloyl-ACP methyl ester carboxylesterase
MREGFIETPDGARVSYRARAGRDPWILLHGLGCDATMWDGVVEALPPDIGIVAVEARGHGGSTLGWKSPSVDLWADDVSRVARAEGLTSPAIAGLSMGGYTALAVAAKSPGFARAYALIDTTAAPDDDNGRLRRANGLATLRTSGWRDYAMGLLPSFLLESRDDFPRHRDHLLTMFDRAREAGLVSALYALASRPDRRSLLPFLQAPCAVVVGEADRLTPLEKAEEAVNALPRSRLFVLPGVAHLSAMEDPGGVADAIREADAI